MTNVSSGRGVLHQAAALTTPPRTPPQFWLKPWTPNGPHALLRAFRHLRLMSPQTPRHPTAAPITSPRTPPQFWLKPWLPNGPHALLRAFRHLLQGCVWKVPRPRKVGAPGPSAAKVGPKRSPQPRINRCQGHGDLVFAMDPVDAFTLILQNEGI